MPKITNQLKPLCNIVVTIIKLINEQQYTSRYTYQLTTIKKCG